MTKRNRHIGSSLDDFLKDEDIYDEVTALVTKDKIVRQRKKRIAERELPSTELFADAVRPARRSPS
jgi:hypothetical protein